MKYIKLFEDKKEKLYKTITSEEVDDFYKFKEMHDIIDIPESLLKTLKTSPQFTIVNYKGINILTYRYIVTIEKYNDNWYVVWDDDTCFNYLCDDIEGLKQCLKEELHYEVY